MQCNTEESIIISPIVVDRRLKAFFALGHTLTLGDSKRGRSENKISVKKSVMNLHLYTLYVCRVTNYKVTKKP